MAKTVLLARPHPFIIAEMKPLLEYCGYAAAKLENLADLAVQAKSSAGVVISLAVSSSLGETAAEVFIRLRQGVPRIPVLFAAMLPLDKALSSLERLAKQTGVQATILGVAAGNENAVALGKPETFLYISKDDLTEAPRRVIASRMIQRHFR
ncbi:MAG: hypothetical protein HHJ12_10895 [Glaciimonas sp.]|nr:hypothetical protein [Glaciimonas sp.]